MQARQRHEVIGEHTIDRHRARAARAASDKIMRRILREVAAGEYEGMGDVTAPVGPEVVGKLVDQHRRDHAHG